MVYKVHLYTPSDKTLTVLARHIQKELLPTLDHDEGNLALIVAASLPLTTVEDAVKSVLVRNNYGVEAPLGVRLPAALYVWRWEVGSDHMDWLPKNSRERAEARLAERVKVSQLCWLESHVFKFTFLSRQEQI